MIWFSLGLFAVSFLATALLAPKPEFENARAESLDPENFPRATEDAPIPLLLGCARIKGPNTLWYGNYNPVPNKKKVKTGLFSSTTVITGHTYYLSFDLGLCLGPAELKTLYIDSVEVDPGTVPAFSEDYELYGCDLGGTRFHGAAPDIGEVCFDTDYSGSSTINNDFDPIVDWELTEDALDGGFLTFKAEYRIQYFVGSGSDSGPANIAVRFFTDDTATTELFSPDGIGAQDDQINATSTESRVVDIECRVPAGTRMVRVTGDWAPVLIVFTATGTTDHKISVEGPFYDYSSQDFDIVEPELYGGRESGGGHIGDVTFYPGSHDQVQDTHLQESLEIDDVPAYRGVCHMMFPDNNIGESPSLRAMEFLIGRITDTLGTEFAGAAFEGSPDINPAEAIHFIITDPWSGLDTPAAKVNIASFLAAAATLSTEEHGCSLVVSSSQQGKQVLREILRQIDGVLAENTDGEVELRLIRDDYTPESLTVYDEDDILEITTYSRTSWRDVVTETKVSFPSRDQDSSRIALAQNAATFNMVGSRRTSEISFPFCYDDVLASALASRELARLSVPLIKMTAIMNRSAYQLAVGSVIKMSFPELGISELICRVQKVDLGALEDNRVTVELIQDIFAVATTVMAPPENSDWLSDRPVPLTVDTAEIVEMPYFLGQRVDTPVVDGQGAVIPFPVKPQTKSTGFTLNVDDESGVLEYFEPASVEYPVTGLIASTYDLNQGFETGLDAAGFTVNTVLGELIAASTEDVRSAQGGLMYVNGEWMAYETVTDNLDDTYTLGNVRRALFGTTPLTHLADTRVFILTPELLGDGFLAGELEEDGTAYYKVLDRVGGVERSAIAETESSFDLADLADRPLRPRLLSIDGSRATSPHDAGSDSAFDISWLPTNRDDTQVTFEDDPTQTPDQTEEYDLEVWVDGVQDMALSDTNITSPYAFDMTGTTGAEAELRLYSRRTTGDLKTSAYYALYPMSLDSLEELSGDMTDGDDNLLTSGDEQSGTDGMKLSGDMG